MRIIRAFESKFSYNKEQDQSFKKEYSKIEEIIQNVIQSYQPTNNDFIKNIADEILKISEPEFEKIFTAIRNEEYSAAIFNLISIYYINWCYIDLVYKALESVDDLIENFDEDRYKEVLKAKFDAVYLNDLLEKSGKGNLLIFYGLFDELNLFFPFSKEEKNVQAVINKLKGFMETIFPDKFFESKVDISSLKKARAKILDHFYSEELIIDLIFKMESIYYLCGYSIKTENKLIKMSFGELNRESIIYKDMRLLLLEFYINEFNTDYILSHYDLIVSKARSYLIPEMFHKNKNEIQLNFYKEFIGEIIKEKKFSLSFRPFQKLDHKKNSLYIVYQFNQMIVNFQIMLDKHEVMIYPNIFLDIFDRLLDAPGNYSEKKYEKTILNSFYSFISKRFSQSEISDSLMGLMGEFCEFYSLIYPPAYQDVITKKEAIIKILTDIQNVYLTQIINIISSKQGWIAGSEMAFLANLEELRALYFCNEYLIERISGKSYLFSKNHHENLVQELFHCARDMFVKMKHFVKNFEEDQSYKEISQIAKVTKNYSQFFLQTFILPTHLAQLDEFLSEISVIFDSAYNRKNWIGKNEEEKNKILTKFYLFWFIATFHSYLKENMSLIRLSYSSEFNKLYLVLDECVKIKGLGILIAYLLPDGKLHCALKRCEILLILSSKNPLNYILDFENNNNELNALSSEKLALFVGEILSSGRLSNKILKKKSASLGAIDLPGNKNSLSLNTRKGKEEGGIGSPDNKNFPHLSSHKEEDAIGLPGAKDSPPSVPYNKQKEKNITSFFRRKKVSSLDELKNIESPVFLDEDIADTLKAYVDMLSATCSDSHGQSPQDNYSVVVTNILGQITDFIEKHKNVKNTSFVNFKKLFIQYKVQLEQVNPKAEKRSFFQPLSMPHDLPEDENKVSSKKGAQLRFNLQAKVKEFCQKAGEILNTQEKVQPVV